MLHQSSFGISVHSRWLEGRVRTYQGNDIRQRAQEYTDPALHVNLLNTLHATSVTAQLITSIIFETYHFRNHLSVELKVTHTLPVHIHVELDAIGLGLVNVHVGEADRNMSKVDLGETQISKRTR